MERNPEFGGKGNGLVWLAQNTDLGFEVPRFEIIDTSFHNSGNLKKLEDRCTELADKFQGEEVAVRSSAVLSEDSDKFSGAGIYDSFFVGPQDLTPQRLQEEVLKVHASVNNDRAVQYRKQIGIGEERMAVVVQKAVEGMNGVAMSRLPQRAGIIPVTWSDTRGAVVGGNPDALIRRAYFTPKNDFQAIFISEGLWENQIQEFQNVAELSTKLRSRYGKEFESEFVIGHDGKTYMLQIRPLTNVQDKEIKFPEKEPIFTAKHCMTVGEYIGPWVTPSEVTEYWDEPSHYAYFAPRLDKSVVDQLRETSRMFGGPENAHLNYDNLTPNKRAMVITSHSVPGMHALTIANEKGIICLAGEGKYDHFKGNKKLADLDRDSRMMVGREMGMTLIERVNLDVALADVGQYVHIVSDGLTGHVYRATEQEAKDFAKGMRSQIDYQVSPLEGRDFGHDMFDVEFRVTPSDLSLCGALCRDFVKHIEKASGRRFRLDVSPAGNCFDVYAPGAECEVYGAMFDPDNKGEGISFSSGRSAEKIANKETTQKWFEDFRSKLTKGYIPTGE